MLSPFVAVTWRRSRGDGSLGALVRVASGKFVGLGASVAGAIVVSRALGPSERGIVSLATAVAGIAAFLFTVGMPAALVWQIGQGQRPAALRRMFAKLVLLPAVGVACLILAATAFTQSSYAHLPLAATVGLAAALSAGVFVTAVFQGLREYGTGARAGAAFALLTSALTSVAAVATGRALPTLVAGVCAAAIAYGHYLRLAIRSWRQSGRQHAVASRTNWRFALLSWFTNFVGEVTLRFDVIVIGFLLSPTEVGLYAAAVGLAQMLQIVPSAAGEIAFAETARAGLSGHERFVRLTGVYMWGIAAVTALGAVLLYAAAPVVIPFLLGEAYSPAVKPLQFLLPGMVGLAVSAIGANALAGRGQVGRNLAIAGPIAILTIVLDLLLIPDGGLAAAAVVSSAMYLLSAGLILFFVVRLRRRPLAADGGVG